jgi:integrase
MPRETERLSALKVEKAKAGMYADGEGLYLVVTEAGSRRWTFVFQWRGKRKETGLGSYPKVSLRGARDLAAIARHRVRNGLNPIEVRRAEREAKPEEDRTFGKFAADLVESLASGFRNPKHIAQWKMTLGIERKEGRGNRPAAPDYCKNLRPMRLEDITTEDVLTVLRPIWKEKPETASRIRGRLEKVLDAAKANGLRSGENPARWRGHLSHLLPKPDKLTRGHHAAMPYEDVPTFVTARLRDSSSMAALALEWTILAASRTGETIGARLDEVDRERRVWTIPKSRMKAKREHRVPITDSMMRVLTAADRVREVGNPYVFPGPGVRRPLSSGAMERLLDRLKVEGVTVHGFRAAFKTWADEQTPYRTDLVEAALAHVVGDATERAYKRGDALAMRRQIMEAWSSYVERGPETVEEAA